MSLRQEETIAEELARVDRKRADLHKRLAPIAESILEAHHRNGGRFEDIEYCSDGRGGFEITVVVDCSDGDRDVESESFTVEELQSVETARRAVRAHSDAAVEADRIRRLAATQEIENQERATLVRLKKKYGDKP